MKISPVGAELLHADRLYEAGSLFSQSSEWTLKVPEPPIIFYKVLQIPHQNVSR